MYRADRFLSLAVLIGAVGLFIQASGLNAKELAQHGAFGSGFWPMLLLGLIVLGSLALAFRSWRLPAEAFTLAKPGRAYLVGGLVFSTFLYSWCIQVLGFLVATPIFLLAMLYAMGMRKVKVLVGVPFGLTGVLGVVFIKFFSVPIPLGYGVFRALHLWVL